jgi:hypothetical protein
MGWDPVLLRKYNTTGHFRLLNQVRSELKGNPLIRPRQGETVGAANRSKGLIRALEVRPQAGGYSRRSRPPAAPPQPVVPLEPVDDSANGGGTTFRDRLNAIDMR